jgi:hypothetical protein
MKRVITVILPLILAAQLPFGTMKYLASEWMNSFEYGLKWTELMMSGYPGAPEVEERVPAGEVTMTVTLASAIPEIEILPTIEIEKEICRVQMEEQFQKKTIEILKQHRNLKTHRLIKIGTVNLIQL